MATSLAKGDSRLLVAIAIDIVVTFIFFVVYLQKETGIEVTNENREKLRKSFTSIPVNNLAIVAAQLIGENVERKYTS